jgi:hypothetical protein
MRIETILRRTHLGGNFIVAHGRREVLRTGMDGWRGSRTAGDMEDSVELKTSADTPTSLRL